MLAFRSFGKWLAAVALATLLAGPALADTYGIDTGPRPTGGAVNGSSHAAGTSVGGLFTINMGGTGGNSGIITNLLWISPGGDTTGKMVRLWSRKPSSSTVCTDQTAFVSNLADDLYLIAAPFTFTPAAPAQTTGDSKTYGNLTNLVYDWANQDPVATNLIYACVIETGTDTADENTTVELSPMGPRNN